MTPPDDLDPARALAERLLDLLPGADLPRAVELIAADRAAVREAALREAIEKLEITAGFLTRSELTGLRIAVERLERLITGGKTHG